MIANATRVELRPVNVERDAEQVYAWSRRPHVREFWQDLGDNRVDVGEYLLAKIILEHLNPYIIVIDGTDAGYAELYDYNRDPVAQIFPGEDGDRGWHIFLGEERFLGTGHAMHAGHAILATLFEHENCRRVLCEPDERNARMLRFVQKLGHRPIGTAVLPDKIATILACRREDFADLGPLPNVSKSERTL